jgi:hypothetical protein
VTGQLRANAEMDSTSRYVGNEGTRMKLHGNEFLHCSGKTDSYDADRY